MGDRMMSWMDANGISLRYDLCGTGTKNVVLIHELGGALESWDYVLPALRKHFTVLRYDQRGFGFSEKARKLSLDTILDDLRSLLDGLPIKQPCHLLGSALGAGIGIAFAAKYPERVERLIACNPATKVKEDRREFLEQRAKMVEMAGMRSVVDQSLSTSYPEAFRKDTQRFNQYRLRWLANCPFSFAAINRMLAEMDVTTYFSHVKCPTLVLAGTLDTLLPPDRIRSIAQSIPNSRYGEVESGHFMALQSPDKLMEVVIPFLTQEI
jgi:3-oxoadipate enol-lactonase